MSVRMRHTRGHTRNRRSHHALKGPQLSKCGNCGEMHIKHQICTNCGIYRGKQMIDVLAKLTKKERKLKEKELAAKENDKSLDAGKLSNK